MPEVIRENSRNEVSDLLRERYFPNTTTFLKSLHFLDSDEGKTVEVDELMKEFCVQTAERIWIEKKERQDPEELVKSGARKLIDILFNRAKLYRKGEIIEIFKRDIPHKILNQILNTLQEKKYISPIIIERKVWSIKVETYYKATLDRARRELIKRIDEELNRLDGFRKDEPRFYCGEEVFDQYGMILPCKGCLGFTSDQIYLKFDKPYKCRDGKNIVVELPRNVYSQIINAHEYLISELKRKLQVLGNSENRLSCQPMDKPLYNIPA